MHPEEVLARRMTNLRLSRPGQSCAEVADWFGAMQSQDLGSGMWSLGVRVGLSAADVEQALRRGEVLRTWPMRGTIHTVHPQNVRWQLALTGVRALRGVAARWNALGLDRPTAERAAQVLADALPGKCLTRAECLEVLAAAGIPAAENGWAYHLLWYTAQIGVSCMGPAVDGQQTFVLLDDWAPIQRSPEDPAALLARMYFRSHGPTTVRDFQGWSGLTLTAARQAVASADLAADGQLYYVPGDVDELPEALLLPGYDEYLLGYKDRSAFLRPEQFAAVVPGGNGVFRPTAVHRGRVVGTWRRKVLTRKVVVTITALARLRAGTRRAFEAPATRYAHYLGRDLEVHWE